ncbi:hypothetical protein INR49_024134 [Caranx melampygus]|nr:hypothetical protein INR49_024134 [Caranx melampygus]
MRGDACLEKHPCPHLERACRCMIPIGESFPRKRQMPSEQELKKDHCHFCGSVGREQDDEEPEEKRPALEETTEEKHSLKSVGLVSETKDKIMLHTLLAALKKKKPVFVLSRELKLRNYTPEDEELKGRQVPKAKPASVEDKVKDQLEAANPEPIIEEVDLANLAPRKPDWDLKRDVAKKLEKLERRTQRAIAELIRDRLRGSEEELAGAVGAI